MTKTHIGSNRCQCSLSCSEKFELNTSTKLWCCNVLPLCNCCILNAEFFPLWLQSSFSSLLPVLSSKQKLMNDSHSISLQHRKFTAHNQCISQFNLFQYQTTALSCCTGTSLHFTHTHTYIYILYSQSTINVYHNLTFFNIRQLP